MQNKKSIKMLRQILTEIYRYKTNKSGDKASKLDRNNLKGRILQM